MISRVECELNGRTLQIETGLMAKQADGAVTVRYGDTMILATVVSPEKLKEGLDFFPLTVDYREKTSAAGKFPGGYLKREGRPTEKEILTARLTDRPIRPLFPKGYLYEVQIMISVISSDGENDPDMLALIGASAALTVSDIPFLGPIGAVRVGMIDGEYVINPTPEQLLTSDLDLVIAGTEKAVMMVEGSSKELSEEVMLKAVMTGHEEIKAVVAIQKELQEKCGRAKREPELFTVDKEIYATLESTYTKDTLAALDIMEKGKRMDAMKVIKEAAVALFVEKDPEIDEGSVKSAFRELEKHLVRENILNEGKRGDGRSPKDIRDISCLIGLLPRAHGSALFTRGETQALASTTLGSSKDAQKSDGLMGEFSKSFMLHYNFPSFSVGEARPNRGVGRREIGHGVLAEKSLLEVMPSAEDFPYTVKIVSDILESNGSSSMATVCGGCLSLMDAGVPIKAPVAGIAMGLVTGENKTVVLSDILGSEDGAGDMDFKVAGTEKGITGFQMDIKIEGINEQIMQEALAQAKEGRMHILGKMTSALASPRSDLSEYAPRITTLRIDKEKIGTLIGPGGKNIKKIIEETGAEININDEGIVSISTNQKEAAEKAIAAVQMCTADVEVGKVYTGTVKNVTAFGAFVEVLPGKEGLVHISKLAHHRVNKVEDEVNVGDEVTVKAMEIDDRGRLSLSRKACMEPEEAKKDE